MGIRTRVVDHCGGLVLEAKKCRACIQITPASGENYNEGAAHYILIDA